VRLLTWRDNSKVSYEGATVMGFSFVEHSFNVQTPEETYLVGAYELGSMIRCYHYHKRYGRGYLKDCEGELSDFISMLRMYCEQTGIDYVQARRSDMFVWLATDSEVSIERSLSRAFAHYGRIWSSGIDVNTAILTRLPRDKYEVPALYVAYVIGDLMQVCKLLNWSYESIQKWGEERYLDRMSDLRLYGLREKVLTRE